MNREHKRVTTCGMRAIVRNVRAERENGEAGMDGTVRNVEMTTEMTGYMWVSVQNTWTEHHNNL